MRQESIRFLNPLLSAGIDYSVYRFRHLVRKDELDSEFFISVHLSLVLTTWRKEVNIPRKKVLQTGALELWSLMRYLINLYDDTIDNDERDRILTKTELKHGHWREDKRISDVTSLLVQKIQSLSIPDYKKNIIFNIIGNFRREQYVLYEEMFPLFSLPHISLQQLEQTKLISGALTMRRMAEVMNILGDVPLKRAREVEDGFHYLGVAGQWIDDIADFEKDNGDVSNLVVAVMSEFNDEYDMCLHSGFTKANFHRSKKTKIAVREKFNSYVSLVPNHCSFLKNSLYFFYDANPLYDLFETNSRIQY